MLTGYYKEKPQKRLVKGIKIFLKKEKHQYTHEQYRNFSEEEKNKCQYICELYRNLPKD